MKRNQYGFSPLFIFIVLVVIAVIGYGGWYVVHKNNQSQSPAAQKASTAEDTPVQDVDKAQEQASPVAASLEIREWGIKIVPADSLPKVTYTIGVDESGLERTKFTFSDLPAECSGLYSLVRAKQGQEIDYYSTTVENIQHVQKIGDYYYFVDHGQVGCGDSEKQNALVKQLFGSPYGYKIVAT